MSYLTLTVISGKPNFSGLVNLSVSSSHKSMSPYAAQHSALKLLLPSVLVLIQTMPSALFFPRSFLYSLLASLWKEYFSPGVGQQVRGGQKIFSSLCSVDLQ